MNANELIKRMEDGYSVSYDEIITMLRQQQAEIEALKAGKIRAYDNGVEDGRKPDTHPVEITDEEITEVINNIAYYGSIAKNDYVNFARAILRKAQEK